MSLQASLRRQIFNKSCLLLIYLSRTTLSKKKYTIVNLICAISEIY